MKKTFPSLTSFETRSREWLLKIQDTATGGWAEHPGLRPSALNTAEVVIALVSSGVEAGNDQIQRAIAFLENDCAALPAPDTGAWCRRVGDSPVRLVPDIVRTSVVVRALIHGGRSVSNPVVAQALQWIVGRQNSGENDTGWGFSRGGKSELLPTCFALGTLLQVYGAAKSDTWKKPIAAGLEQLDRFRKSDRSFGDENLKAPHTLLAVLALQSARSCGFPTVAKTETDALEWLLDNQDEALAPVEESIPIDTVAGGGGNYGFTYTMHSLLLQAIASSSTHKHRETTLWTDTQRGLVQLQDETTGAFYGSRVFSWSTAWALYSITHAEKHLGNVVPARPPEDPAGTKVGNFILLLAVVLFGGVVYLAQQQRFTSLVAIVFGFLMLACLLAYGRIREKTFGQLVGGVLKREAGSDKEQPAK